MNTEPTKLNQMWRLARRPHGEIGDDIFDWSEEPIAELQDGEALVRTVYLSLDPTNRIWISDVEGYMPPVAIGEVMRGMGIGEVVASRHPTLKVGEMVQGLFGWQRYATTDGQGVVPIPKGLPFPLPAFMAVLNHIGATAYFGLLELGQPKPGDTVVVSAAAGAVGSLVGQLAKLEGCRVIGIAGTDDKCAWLTGELGFDGAINRRTENIAVRLKELCPKGIDIYFDNVGGEILDTCLDQMRLFGRIVLCGLISGYNATEPPPGPRNFGNILIRRLRVQGFIVLDYMDRFMEMAMKLGPLIGTGKLAYRVDLAEGLEQAPAALRRLFSGGNTGKLVVKVGEEP
ncbi:MAG TPA: NADP-dependent oxidoreductase [Kofleriaceae bacterium]|nr:NADP-dependent oxidoreductase [Kofleriaceae bacterium]